MKTFAALMAVVSIFLFIGILASNETKEEPCVVECICPPYDATKGVQRCDCQFPEEYIGH